MNQTFQLPKTITLTDAAADRVKHIMAQSDENYLGVRLGLKNAGCAGMEYTMEYATEILPQDEVVEDKGVTVLVDLKAVLFLIGTEMDFQTENFLQVLSLIIQIRPMPVVVEKVSL